MKGKRLIDVLAACENDPTLRNIANEANEKQLRKAIKWLLQWEHIEEDDSDVEGLKTYILTGIGKMALMEGEIMNFSAPKAK